MRPHVSMLGLCCGPQGKAGNLQEEGLLTEAGWELCLRADTWVMPAGLTQRWEAAVPRARSSDLLEKQLGVWG